MAQNENTQELIEPEGGAGAITDGQGDEDGISEEIEGPSVEYSAEPTAEDVAAAGGEDSDSAHRSADPDDGDDYTNYAETVQDGEEQREEQPSNLDGNARVADPDVHEVNTDLDATTAAETGASDHGRSPNSVILNATDATLDEVGQPADFDPSNDAPEFAGCEYEYHAFIGHY